MQQGRGAYWKTKSESNRKASGRNIWLVGRKGGRRGQWLHCWCRWYSQGLLPSHCQDWQCCQEVINWLNRLLERRNEGWLLHAGYTSVYLSRVSWEPFKLPGPRCTPQLRSQMLMGGKRQVCIHPCHVFRVERNCFVLRAAPWFGGSRDHNSKALTRKRLHVPVILDEAWLCSGSRGGFWGQQPCIQPAPGFPCLLAPSLALVDLPTAALKWGLNSSWGVETASSRFCKARLAF